jgi:phenylalanine-4-hydroxylase
VTYPAVLLGRVELDEGHPGFADPAYRARRDELAALAAGWHRGGPVPHADYTAAEDAVWATVCRELAPLHGCFAARCVREAIAAVDLPRDRIPQLEEVSARLRPLTGFRYGVVPGLADLRDFYGALAGDLFLSTQYIRHPSLPLYTPEPDVVHEVLGHAITLGSPVLADLYRAAGRAVHRLESRTALEVLSKVFWFTLEFGVVEEQHELRTYGAGILSSYGEIQAFRGVEVRELDTRAMARQAYDITRYQPVLFAGRGMAEVVDVVGTFFDGADDDGLLALVA